MIEFILFDMKSKEMQGKEMQSKAEQGKTAIDTRQNIIQRHCRWEFVWPAASPSSSPFPRTSG